MKQYDGKCALRAANLLHKSNINSFIFQHLVRENRGCISPHDTRNSCFETKSSQCNGDVWRTASDLRLKLFQCQLRAVFQTQPAPILLFQRTLLSRIFEKDECIEFDVADGKEIKHTMFKS